MSEDDYRFNARRALKSTPGGVGRLALTLSTCHLVLVFIGIIIFRMTQRIFIVELEFLGDFDAFVDRWRRADCRQFASRC
jgi:hypothetical protein